MPTGPQRRDAFKIVQRQACETRERGQRSKVVDAREEVEVQAGEARQQGQGEKVRDKVAVTGNAQLRQVGADDEGTDVISGYAK